MSRRNRCTAVLKFTANEKRLIKRARPSRHSQGVAFTAGEGKEQLAALEAKAFHWIARGRAANVELGRVFIEIKAIVGHGRWERYYAERFGSSGLAPRTAQTYMQMARTDNEISKTADSAVFLPTTDPQTQAIDAATERALTDVGGAALIKVKRERIRLEGPGLYKLPPIHLMGDEMDACDALVKSQWPRTEQEIIALLNRLYAECGIVPGENHEDSLA